MKAEYHFIKDWLSWVPGWNQSSDSDLKPDDLVPAALWRHLSLYFHTLASSPFSHATGPLLPQGLCIYCSFYLEHFSPSPHGLIFRFLLTSCFSETFLDCLVQSSSLFLSLTLFYLFRYLIYHVSIYLLFIHESICFMKAKTLCCLPLDLWVLEPCRDVGSQMLLELTNIDLLCCFAFGVGASRSLPKAISSSRNVSP